jgi:D-amino peptidase
MKVYIITDMEGVAGVVNWDDYGAPGARYYEIGRMLTTGETNAAVEGAIEAGATEVLVVDGHGSGALNPQLLHPAAKLLAGRPIGYPFGCDETFGAAMIVGQHAKSNTDGGHLSHTQSFTVEEYTINGVSLGELGCNMLFCSYFGAPTVMVSGDAAAAGEARALVPNIATAAVKEGLCRGPATGLTGEQNKLHNGAATHLSHEKARELIHEAARDGLTRLGDLRPYRIEPPYEAVNLLRKTTEAPQRRGVAHADDLLELLRTPMAYSFVTEAG